jgi:hypothetical protein
MSIETVRLVGQVFVTAASIISLLMLVVGALGDVEESEREGRV